MSEISVCSSTQPTSRTSGEQDAGQQTVSRSQRIAQELLDTEGNYVNKLHLVDQVCRVSLWVPHGLASLPPFVIKNRLIWPWTVLFHISTDSAFQFVLLLLLFYLTSSQKCSLYDSRSFISKSSWPIVKTVCFPTTLFSRSSPILRASISSITTSCCRNLRNAWKNGSSRPCSCILYTESLSNGCSVKTNLCTNDVQLNVTIVYRKQAHMKRKFKKNNMTWSLYMVKTFKFISSPCFWSFISHIVKEIPVLTSYVSNDYLLTARDTLVPNMCKRLQKTQMKSIRN